MFRNSEREKLREEKEWFVNTYTKVTMENITVKRTDAFAESMRRAWVIRRIVSEAIQICIDTIGQVVYQEGKSDKDTII